MAPQFGIGDIAVATSYVLQLITRVDNLWLDRYSEDSHVYFAVLVEVKDLMAASPDAIPASAIAALEVCKHKQSRLIECLKNLGLESDTAIQKFRNSQHRTSFGFFQFNLKSAREFMELERMLDEWKSAVMLLKDLAIQYEGPTQTPK